MAREPEREHQVPPQKARQGNSSRNILIVLVVSLAAAMVLWWIVDLFYDTPEDTLTDSDQVIREKNPADPTGPAGTR